MAKTLLSQVKGFVTSQNNSGKNGLVLMKKCIEHMYEHGDWTPVAWLISQSIGQDKNRLRAIFGKCVGGVTMSTLSKAAKEQPSGVHITLGDNSAPTEMYTVLEKLIEDGESFRGQAVAKELLKSTNATVFNIDSYAKRLVSKLDKEGVNMKDLLEAVGKVTAKKVEKAA